MVRAQRSCSSPAPARSPFRSTALMRLNLRDAGADRGLGTFEEHVIGEKWSLLVVRELAYGVHRFDSVVRNTGAPRDILTNRLRGLESAGVVEKRQYLEHPPRFEYHLTEAGRELRPVLSSLGQWGDRW